MATDVGDIAPVIDLVDHSGNRWCLSDHGGRPVVLIYHRHLG
jgi:peroxiredoxin